MKSFLLFLLFLRDIIISCGKFLLSRFLLSRRNKGNSRNYSYRPPRSSFCYFCYFCGKIITPRGKFFYCPTEIKEIKEILLPSLGEALSAISAGLLVSHAESFLSRRNKRNQGNLNPPRRSTFCYFCHFCGTISISCGKFLLSRFLLSRRNKGNSRNYSYRPPRSSFCSFCGTIYLVRKVFIVPQSSALPLRLSKK